jgi:predicted DNA-binding transcriptional regulator AlpA
MPNRHSIKLVDDELYEPNEVCQFMRISRATLDRLLAAGIGPRRVWPSPGKSLFWGSDVKKYLEHSGSASS